MSAKTEEWSEFVDSIAERIAALPNVAEIARKASNGWNGESFTPEEVQKSLSVRPDLWKQFQRAIADKSSGFIDDLFLGYDLEEGVSGYDPELMSWYRKYFAVRWIPVITPGHWVGVFEHHPKLVPTLGRYINFAENAKNHLDELDIVTLERLKDIFNKYLPFDEARSLCRDLSKKQLAVFIKEAEGCETAKNIITFLEPIAKKKPVSLYQEIGELAGKASHLLILEIKKAETPGTVMSINTPRWLSEWSGEDLDGYKSYQVRKLIAAAREQRIKEVVASLV